MCICALCIYDVTHFLRVQRMKASEFGRPCLTNAHLAFGSKGDARSKPGMTKRSRTMGRYAADKRRKGPRTYGFLSLSLFISLLKEASTVQEPLDVGTTVEDPPTELDGDEISRTGPVPEGRITHSQ